MKVEGCDKHFMDCLQWDLGVGKRRNQISWWSSNFQKNPINMYEELIEWIKKIIQAFRGIVKTYRTSLKLWVMGRRDAFCPSTSPGNSPGGLGWRKKLASLLLGLKLAPLKETIYSVIIEDGLHKDHPAPPIQAFQNRTIQLGKFSKIMCSAIAPQ